MSNTVRVYCVKVSQHEVSGDYEMFFDFQNLVGVEAVAVRLGMNTQERYVNPLASLMLMSVPDSPEQLKSLPETGQWYELPLDYIAQFKEHISYPNNSRIIYQLRM